MKFIKRVLAGVSALSIAINPLFMSDFAVVAENEENVTENVTDNQTNSDSSESQYNIESEQKDTVIESTALPQATSDSEFPSLKVDNSAQENWSNSTTGWQIIADDNAIIYYKTSKDGEEDWGTYQDAAVWNNSNYLPEGENYVKFWAVFPDTGAVTENDAILYRYDKTVPNNFNLIEENLTVKPAEKIWDANFPDASGISEVYYKIDEEEVTSLDELKETAQKVDIKIDSDGKADFSIQLSNLEEVKNITVYAIDKAGNIQSASSPTITTDDAAPWLNVNVPDSNKWYNSIDGWNISTAENATIYYKISDTDQEDWGTYKDKDAIKWNNGDNLPEGKHYIKLWAAYPDNIRKINDSVKPFVYQLDKTLPSEFILVEGKSLFQLFLKPDKKINDTLSGISGIYYIVGGNEAKNIHELNGMIQSQFAKKVNYSLSEDIDFSLPVTYEMKGQTIRVYVTDNAGNFRMVSTTNSGDADVPQFDKNVGVEIVSITEDNGSFEESQVHEKHTFGSEKLKDSYPLTNFYYTGDNSYLRFNLTEEHQEDVIITVSISDSESVTFKASEMCKISDIENASHPLKFTSDQLINSSSVGIRIDNKNNVSTYYIPVKELASKFKLTASNDNKVYKFSVSASDGKYNHKTDENNNIKIEDVYYNPSDSQDSCIQISLSDDTRKISYEDGLVENIDAYFFGIGADSNSVDISFSDDIGIANYEVQLVKVNENGSEIPYVSTSVDLSDGIEQIGTYTETTVVVNENNEEETSTVEKEEKYQGRATKSEQDTVPITKPEKIVFSSDGYYKLKVILVDLEGNKSIIRKNYIVDTNAPTIDDFNYEIKSGFLHYLTFGIYGNEEVVLAIKISDGTFMSGVSENNIKLYWDDEEYDAHNEGEWYVFDNLSPTHNDSPFIEITDRLGHKNIYYFTTITETEDTFWTDKTDDASNDIEFENKLVLNDDESGIALVLERNAPKFTVTPNGSNFRTDLGIEGNSLYFGEKNLTDDSDSKISFVFSDDEGLEFYEFSVLKNKEELHNKHIEERFITERTVSAGNFEENQQEIFINVDDLETGKYELVGKVVDLAGNESTMPDNCSFNYGTFYVDKTAPTIINTEYEVVPSILNYLTFGIFGNSTINISVKVTDNEDGCGVDKVELFWAGKTYSSVVVSENTYTFKSLEVVDSGIPYIIVTDKIGNSNKYYFSSNKKEFDENRSIGELILNDNTSAVILALENEKPYVSVKVPDTYKAYDVNGQIWFGTDVKYTVRASDIIEQSENTVHSGLSLVKVFENDSENAKYSETSYTKEDSEIKFDEVQFLENAEYTYDINEAGNYSVNAVAYDNALNSSSDSIEFSIDKENPKIILFKFGGLSDLEPYFERDTYGYFFDVEIEARVYVNDPDVSSGFNHVNLYLSNVNGTTLDYSVSGSSLNTDESGIYASFTIPMGFKGKVVAEVVDNVEHSSGRINANGNIIENQDIHSETSSINITPNINSVHVDANDVPLYNESIPLTVTIEDTFSGISTIEWSIANDDRNGIITVNSDGIALSDSNEAVIDTDSILRDNNLITSLQFSVSVESNTNNNVVKVNLTDRSGNVSSSEKVYSIDEKEPEILLTLKEGVEPSNDRYYNADQEVTVHITERNFNASDVKIVINGEETKFDDWNETTIGQDDSEHKYTFPINSDGEYQISVSYTDMAGNAGTSYTLPLFLIDKTAPKISNNFEDFGSIDDDKIYFNIQDKEKAKAIITVKEKNFYANDMDVKMYFKSAGTQHKDDDQWIEKKYYSSDWKENGTDTHTLEISFDKDGVYKVTMNNPVDRANNSGMFIKDGDNKGEYQKYTAIFEADYTVPQLYSRNGKKENLASSFIDDVYDLERIKNSDTPDMIFEDTNIDYVEYDLLKYTPKEKDIVKPISYKGKLTTTMKEDSQKIQFILPDFNNDGVYSVKILVHDKAGNVSEAYDNTYIRMIDTDVLAYLESNQKDGTGWYSIEDEKGYPISKQPRDFEDLSIVVLSKAFEKSKILLVDTEKDEIKDTEIVPEETDRFDKNIFGASVYQYILKGSYFNDNYNVGIDKILKLKVENAGKTLTLGEIHIDSTAPKCKLNSNNYKNWGYIKSDGDYVLEYIVEEDLYIDETTDSKSSEAIIDGKIAKLSEKENSTFYYDKEKKTLRLKLSPGSHSIGLTIYDKAKNTNSTITVYDESGNEYSISSVEHLAIGMQGLWENIGPIFIVTIISISLIILIIFIINKRRRNV